MAESDATPAEPTPAEALAKILACVHPLPVESRPLATLRGAALAEDISAERDQPPFDRVTMDGVGLASSAWAAGRRRFRIAGIQAAGAAPLKLGSSDDCLEVMTGAMLPRGCDAVVPFERLRIADGYAELADEPRIEPFVNVHTRALDCRAGERLLENGTRIGGPELMVIASAGRARAQVRAEPRIIVVTTGDRARKLSKPPIIVLGTGESHDHCYVSSMPSFTRSAAVETGAAAFDMAGLGPEDMDMAQIYDAFTIMVLLGLEDLGFCRKGEGGRMIDAGIGPGARFPVNTSGGGLRYCHPGMFGIFLLVEAVRQLRNECGRRQVANARHALVHGFGGVLAGNATVILGRDERSR